MLKVTSTLADNSLPLAHWAKRAIGLSGIQVKVRSRENKLHILCEGQTCPDRNIAVDRLIGAIKATGIDALLGADEPPIHQVFIYGRVVDQKRPEWTEKVDIEQLYSPRRAGMAVSPQEPPSGLVKYSGWEGQSPDISLQEQAHAGDTHAIARYLGKNLKSLGVKVKVVARPLPKKDEDEEFGDNITGEIAPGAGASSYGGSQKAKEQRLWVFCESAYNPDPSLLAAPVAQQLRELRLVGFQDAVILSQVTGEATPEWMLRVDLTPPEEMLLEWASWGDAASISRFLSLALAEIGIAVTAVLKESTLHISCHHANANRLSATHPDKQECVSSLAPILESLAPRGIFAATIYGHAAIDAPPSWVAWLDLPAARNLHTAKSALSLAKEGDVGAIAFLLGQFLNPDLDSRLATGGIRIQVRFRDSLLYVMTDAPVCPSQQLVAGPTAQLLRDMQIYGVEGVKIYGRRAGQKQPLWSHGVDFVNRKHPGPEVVPEFPAHDVYSGDLLTQPEERRVKANEKIAWRPVSEGIGSAIANYLVRSQLFVFSDPTRFDGRASQISYQGAKVALVWATVGVLLTASVDLVLGQILRPKVNVAGSPSLVRSNTGANRLPQMTLRRAGNNKTDVFDTTGFTQPGNVNVSVDATGKNATVSNSESFYPSFNNLQLDEKLAFYQKHVAEKGAPDVLIVGSSRALRGIEPRALEEALAAQGYGKIEVFNFGVNGATAQVVDLMIRQILTPEQLPKLIVWADGARAFNSGRIDGTYRAIAESAGYRLLASGTLKGRDSEDVPRTGQEHSLAPNPSGGVENILATNSKQIDSWLNQSLATLSSTYPVRDRLQTLLQEGIGNTLSNDTKLGVRKQQYSDANQQISEWDGFFPVSIRFDPETYYEEHAKVTGEYDKDYQNFQMGGDQAIALESLVQFTQARQIPLVFIHLPLTEEYLDKVRSKYEQEFTLSMLRLSLSREFIFRDWSSQWSNKNDYFSDPSHLNRYGAAAVAKRLAQDPLIPWPKP